LLKKQKSKSLIIRNQMFFNSGIFGNMGGFGGDMEDESAQP